MTTLGMVTVVVDDYDRAIDFYVRVLGFSLVEDAPMGPDKRWVVISPGDAGARLLIAKATGPEQGAAIGNSTGGRVGFFLYTEVFNETYRNYRAAQVEFTEEPRNEEYGRVVVFKDIFGNKWDLIEGVK
jgi:catechol 2,3-dioxygenase-like lactoylglutathione lyase family enzyme